MLHYVVLFKSVLPLEDGVVAQSARERQRLGAVQVVVDPPTVVVLEPLAALDALHFGHVCKKSHNVNAPF
jgi:ABC-type taurine transport system ATPase subunit